MGHTQSLVLIIRDILLMLYEPCARNDKMDVANIEANNIARRDQPKFNKLASEYTKR